MKLLISLSNGKFVLNFSKYATNLMQKKKVVKNNIIKNVVLVCLKSDVDKLDIIKLLTVPTDLNSFKYNVAN